MDERAEMIRILGELGVAPDEVPENAGEVAALASDVILARGDRYSAEDLAALVGLETPDLVDLFGHLGIRVDTPGTVLFGDADVELARYMKGAVDEVLTDDEGTELLHVISTALATIAEAAVAGHVQGPERRAADGLANVRLNARITELGLSLGMQLSPAFRHHLRQAAWTQRRTTSEHHRELVALSVGFLDLVGFTSLSQHLEIHELVDLVKGFERRAHELAHRHDTRIVKLIGDEVMFVAEQPDDAAGFAAGMLATFVDDDVIPRGGLAHGELVNVHGDYFGPVVNLAARLTDAAVPGEVLVEETVASVIESEPAGRRMLKGFDEAVRVWSLAIGADGSS